MSKFQTMVMCAVMSAVYLSPHVSQAVGLILGFGWLVGFIAVIFLMDADK